MPNKMRRCKHCKEYFPADEMVKAPAGMFCTATHAFEWGKAENKKKTERAVKKAKSERNADTKRRRKELAPRTRYLSNLQILVNQYVVQVRDKDKPCYTCGTTADVKYDAGHRFHVGRGGADPRRFELMNIHKQCSVQCNQHGGGMPLEYDKALINEYGQEAVERLHSKAEWPSLLELFPNNASIELEIERYRELLKSHGIKPKGCNWK